MCNYVDTLQKNSSESPGCNFIPDNLKYCFGYREAMKPAQDIENCDKQDRMNGTDLVSANVSRS